MTSSQNTANITGTNYVGGYVGQAVGTSIKIATNNNVITGKGYVGGIAGYCGNLTDCTNYGNIVSSAVIVQDSNSRAYVGGIAGYATLINDCTNNADITVTTGGSYVGGIVGYLMVSKNNTCNKNTNNGEIVGKHCVGGIAGQLQCVQPGTSSNGNINFTNNKNTKNISGSGNYIGGLIGYQSSADYNDWGTHYYTYLTIASCQNEAIVNGEDYTGGLLGYAGKLTEVTSSSNTADITGGNYVGGYVGQAVGTSIKIATNAYFALVPFNLLMITLPTLSAIPLFIVSVVLICAKKIGHIRVLAIVLLAISVLSVGVAGIVDWAIDTTQYTVTLDFNGGTCKTNEILVRYGKKMPIIEAPEKTGYIFEGYFDSIDGGKQYYYSDMTSASKWDKKEDSTLYAHWDAKKFTITFDKQGGENGSNSVTAIYGKPMPAATAPQRSGYSFQGYYTSTNIKYYDSQMNSLRNWDRTENLTLYARWESTLSLSVSPGSISDLSGSTTITLTASGGSGNYTFRIDNNPSGISCSLSGNKLTVTKKDNNTSGSIRIVVKDNTYGTTATRNISYTTSGCVAAGTLVTMADGSYKKIEDVCAGDIILSWNFITGQIEAVPVSLYWNHGEDNYKVLNLDFSDDVHVRVINTHGFFDYSLNKFVYITNDNYADYINHEFAYLDMTGLKKVKLLSVAVSEEIVGCYSLRTACNDNAVVSGLLSLTWEDYAGMLTYFEVGEDMKYDAQKMQADIEAYGLYYYDEWSEYVTYEEFIALNGQYFKILVGKGILREEDIIGLIEGMRN